MSLKIVFAALMHESNTFSAKKTTYDMWIPADWRENIGWALDKNEGVTTEGFHNYAEQNNVTVIPALVAMGSGPILSADCYSRAVQTLLDSIRPHLDDMDGLLLGLHGGAAAEGMDDVETDILSQIRGLVGNVPIAVPMDLHGNIGADMSKYCDIVVACKEYPHTDMLWAIEQAFKLLVKTIRREIGPAVGIVRLPMLMPPAAACTFDEPMKSVNTFIKNYCAKHNLLDASFFHGFPFADITCGSSSVVVTTNGADAKIHAAAIASYIWSRRAEFVPNFASSAEGVARALEIINTNEQALVIINETSDNPGGGAPCDGTHTLRVLLEESPQNACFGLINDAEAASAAHAAGEGAEIAVTIGGKTDGIHGTPVAVNAKVIRVTDGVFVENGPMSIGKPVNLGPCALLKIGNVLVGISSAAYQLMGDGFLRMLGVDVKALRLLCIKSSQHFRAFYEPLAQEIITVDPPGIHTSNLAQLTYCNIIRPIYPLDADAEFRAC